MKTMNRFLTTATACLAITMAAHAEDWPQYQGPRRDGVWRETGIVETLPATAEYRWRTPIGAGFAGPAVAAGRVYLCDRVEPTGDQQSEYRWDKKDPVQGLERILCLDADTGAVLWKHEYPCRYTISYPSGPRATPTVCDGRVYCLGAMGDLLCLHAETGRVVWSKNYVRDYGTEINPWGMAFLVKHEDRFLLFNEHGELILARLSPEGYEEIGRMAVLEPTMKAGRRMVVWSPPAFAHRALFARNDKEIVCVDLAAPLPGKAE